MPASATPHDLEIRKMMEDGLPDSPEEIFGIADLCAEFGVTPRTLRFYEDKDLLHPRRINSARVYSRRDRARLALILRSKAIGASLQEIRQYLDLYGHRGEGRERQLEWVIERTERLIPEMEAKRTAIEQMLADLREVDKQARKRLREVQSR